MIHYRVSTVHVEDLRNECRKLWEQGWRFLTMVASDEPKVPNYRFVLRYLFASNDGSSARLFECAVPDDGSYPSITHFYPVASWYERETADLFGLTPIGHPDLRPLVLHEHWPEGMYPLRKDYNIADMPSFESKRTWTYPRVEGKGVFEVPVGPIHAGIIEPGHFRFQVMGESVLHLESKLFYTHRGLEKRAEGLNLEDGLQIAERLCGVCNVSHALSYAQAVEQLTGANVPLRANYIRVFIAELERIYNHVGDIGNLCAGVGYVYGSQRGALLKEQLMQVNDELVGHRFLRGMITLGGVHRDVSHAMLQDTVIKVSKIADEVSKLVNKIRSNDIIRNRMQTTGILPKEVAIEYGTVGPAARASGIDIDARKNFAYAAYGVLSFQVPVLSDGDVMARFLLRWLEVEQSVRILHQIVTSIPEGEVRTDVLKPPPHTFGIGVTESARGENVHFVMTDEHGTIGRYRVRSAAYANWPVVQKTVPGNIIADFPLINKSFELCYACCDR